MKIELIHGDCLEVLKTIPDKSIDLILQDPPYNTTACEWEWDIMIKIDEFWKEWLRVTKDNAAMLFFSAQPFASKLIMSNLKLFRYEIIWQKTMPVGFLNAKKMPLRAHENILVFYKKLPIYNPQFTQGKPYYKAGGVKKEGVYRSVLFHTINNKTGHRYPIDVVKFSNCNYKSLHPTQKPVKLIEYLIKTYTNEGDTLFDGFMGSGTTGVACKKLNRNFIGVELDEKYYKIAQERINSIPDNLFTV